MGLSAWLFDFLLRGFPPDGEACFHVTASLMLKYGRLSIWGPQDWEGVPIAQAVRAGIAGLRAGHGGGLSAWGRISRLLVGGLCLPGAHHLTRPLALPLRVGGCDPGAQVRGE